MRNKINMINEESQVKLQDTMQKIVNDSNGGLVCHYYLIFCFFLPDAWTLILRCGTIKRRSVLCITEFS